MRAYKWIDAQKAIKNGNVYLWMGSTWCIDCKEMQPIVESVEKRCLKEKLDITFVKVDADEAGLFRKPDPHYNVAYVPAHIFIKNGEVKLTLYEMQPEEVIYQEIIKLINNR